MDDVSRRAGGSVTAASVTEPGGSETAGALALGILEGLVVEGRYRIGQPIGSGGMGVVFAAEHLDLGELVAIKFLKPGSLAQGADALSRFAREAWAASKIKSEYVARVSDVGRLENGTPFLVMEYLEGVDLSDMLESGALEIEQAIELVLQACEALAEAHALGIVHRDLKPSNLFCVRRSDGLLAIKVLDFGISKITAGGVADLRLTESSATVGSPLYMSPEQMSSARVVDERSDVWSLGVILYESLTCELPFDAGNLPELAVKIATERPKPIRTVRSEVPAALERVIARCLEKRPEDRYADVAELARALAPFGPKRAIAHADRATRVLQVSQHKDGPVRRAAARVPDGSHARLRGVTVLLSARPGSPLTRPAVIGLIVAAALAGAVLLAMRTREVPPPAPPTTAIRASVAPAPPPRTVEPPADPAPPPTAAQPAPEEPPPAAASHVNPSVRSQVEEVPAPPREARPPRAEPPPASKLEPRPRTVKPPSANSELDSLGGRL